MEPPLHRKVHITDPRPHRLVSALPDGRARHAAQPRHLIRSDVAQVGPQGAQGVEDLRGDEGTGVRQ